MPVGEYSQRKLFLHGNRLSATNKLISTIAIDAGKNIVSLATAGNLLIIGEGQSYGAGASGNRLLVMDINPGSAHYNQAISLKGTGVEQSKYGVTGMTVGPDGHTLVVAVPKMQDTVARAVSAFGETGDVLIFDLNKLDFRTGNIAAPVKAILPSDGHSGKAPLTITATKDADRYLVGNVKDYNRGLSTLVLTRDAEGVVTSAVMTHIDMSQPGRDIVRDRLDIQRAQSAVLVEYKGIEYAIVADDNYNFNDPYFNAMFEAPNFLFPPMGPPIAFGGSASAKRVAVGGKLGIIQDPFGAATFIGATLPLAGYGITNLSVSPDGLVLIGQLKGGYDTPFDGTQNPHQSHAWNVGTLLEAALAHPEEQRMRKHIVVDNAELLIPTPGSAPAGTSFDDEIARLTVEGRMGDVVEVDLRKLLRQKLGLGDARIGNFVLDHTSVFTYDDADATMRLVTVPGAGGDRKPLSRQGTDNLQDADFYETGRMFLAPNLTDADVAKLRAGQRVDQPKTAELSFNYRYREDNGEWVWRCATVSVTAKDIATINTFFGDRDLKNPGYSEFKLKSDVKTGSTDALDVYRVEQRLKYLGFPAMGTGTGNTIKNFTVDGKFGVNETAALKLFEKVVRFKDLTAPGATGNDSKFGPNTNGADGIIGPNDAAIPGTQYTSLNWLNAYNAPHWMDLGGQMDNGSLPGWQNTQDLTATNRVERYGTSWVRDLMRAKSSSWNEFFLAPPATGSVFTGAVDGNHGYTLTAHASHGLGMNFDLFIGSYITGAFLLATAPVGAAINTNLSTAPAAGVWSNQYAVDLSAQLPNYQVTANGVTSANYQLNAMRDFLALYSVTRNNGAEANGWDDLSIVNDGARTALFGDGSQSGSLIRRVIVGSRSPNPLTGATNNESTQQRMRDVLGALGVVNTTWPGHNNHFHVDLKPPTLVQITGSGSNLLLAAGPASTSTGQGSVPASSASASKAQYDAVMSVCSFVVPSGRMQVSQSNGIDPVAAAQHYFHVRGTDLNLYQDPSLGLQPEPVEVTLLEGPSHGELQSGIYRPNEGYLGRDQMTFAVEVKGKKFKVIYSVWVDRNAPDNIYKYPESYLNKTCPSGFDVKELPGTGGAGDKGSSLDILELPTDGQVSVPKRGRRD